MASSVTRLRILLNPFQIGLLGFLRSSSVRKPNENVSKNQTTRLNKENVGLHSAFTNFFTTLCYTRYSGGTIKKLIKLIKLTKFTSLLKQFNDWIKDLH